MPMLSNSRYNILRLSFSKGNGRGVNYFLNGSRGMDQAVQKL
jgi:hypothetical protein